MTRHSALRAGFVALLATFFLAVPLARAASVGAAGYTNSFEAQPAPADWSTASRAGASNDSYDMDTDVITNALVSASFITNQVTSSAGNPPGALATATWSSTGQYLQTRAASQRYTMLLARFVNNTGTNATEFAISYTLSIAGNAAAEDAGKGTHVYYSFTGATGSWINLPSLNTTATNGSYNLSTNLAVLWPYGTNLFVLWVDDNAISPTDVGNQIDNFSVRVTAGAAPTVFAWLDAPTNNSVHFSDATILASSRVTNGTPPYVVQYYTNSGLGNTAFQFAGSIATSPYNLTLGPLATGTYNLYATAVDENGSGSNFSTVTNTFSVVNAIVTLTSPTNSQRVQPGQPFTMTATVAVGASMTVTNVEFFYDGVSAGADPDAPYSTIVASPVEGAHTAYAIATDNFGRQTYSTTNQFNVQVDPLGNNLFVNRYPLATPATVIGDNTGANNEPGEPTFQFGGGLPTIIWGATLWWTWTAPFDGTVTIDTFGSSINTVLSVYTGSSVNALTLVARNDNANGSTASSLVSFPVIAGTEYQIQMGGTGGFGQPVSQGPFQLNLSMPPVVAITNPAPNSVFLAGSNIPVQVTAFSGAGTVTNVSLYRGGMLLGSTTNAPYSFVVSNSPVGSNTLYAVAIDSIGQVGVSPGLRFLVADVGVTITSPQDSTTFLNTNPISFSAYTYLPVGAMANVTFLVDGTPIGQANAEPFTITWNQPAGGSHRITATGVDGLGNVYQAQPVFIAVGQLLVHSNAVWKYLDDGSNQSNAWYAVTYDDTGWSSGPAELGYGDNDEATMVNSGPAGAFFITTYFRRSFEATNVASISNMLLSLAYDDAAAVYLNGTEIYRTANLPAGAAYNTTATGGAIEETLVNVALPPLNLVEGNNVIAVEMHQEAPNSSDISFFLQLVGVPAINRNQFPSVTITNPVNNAGFVAPASLTVSASASDADGTVTNVEFFADGVKIGEAATSPYTASWIAPGIGLHTLRAIATDNQGGRGQSAPVSISIYAANGNPLVRITSPTNDTIVEGPTNMLVTALASALDGVTNVEFLANGSSFGSATTAPYSALWNAPFGINQIKAIVSGANGKRGTSDVVNVTITIPPTNTVGPTVVRQFPAAFTAVTNNNFTNVTIVFSERVQGVDASDVLINGSPATAVTGSGSNYVFSFPRPPYGEVEVAFVSGHGITDFGYPTNIAYNELDGSGFWEYDYDDVVPPTVASRLPAAGAFVTNLTTISVTFSEAVMGVDAADLLVNGTPAFGFIGAGSNYVFNVEQPNSGTVNVTWATNHGITDLGVTGPPIAFNRTGQGATWSFTLDSRTTLVQSNSTWKFIKGLSEASDPTNAWRQLAFDDSGWSNSLAPFVFGEPRFTNALTPGTVLDDMTNNAYTSIYLRKTFVVSHASAITNLLLNHQSDDGFIAWINGTQVLRYNMPTGEVAFNGSALNPASETGGNSGVPFIVANLGTNGVAALVNGTNVLAVHAFNHVTNPPSSDFAFNAQLYTFIFDPSLVPPRVVSAAPAQGDVFDLTSITVTFSESVTNVNAADLLVNGVPATAVNSSTNTTYMFSFVQPAYGPVLITWAADHGIVDLDEVPKPFNANVSSARFTYALVNTNAPVVAAQMPIGGTTITGLTSIAVTFSKAVTGVDAADLLMNGGPANSVTGSGSNYTFFVDQPAYGIVTVRWATNNGIHDVAVPANEFDYTRPTNQWNYSLVNPVPTVTMTSPTNNAYILAPANIPFRANATDNDGTIALVEYYDTIEGAVVAFATNAPYSGTWSNISVGTYIFRAVATDNTGLKATSAPVVINVVTEIPALLLRGPYLQSGSSTGALVRWRTDREADSLVRYGPSINALTNFAIGTVSNTEHIVRIGGLQPSTKYFYTIGSSNRTLAGGTNVTGDGTNYWFITSPVAGTYKPTRIWVLGDSGTANANARAVRDAYYTTAATNGPADFWLMLGDNAYNSGTDAEHQAAIFEMYPETLRNLFLWPVIGNHESSQSYSTNITFPYLDIFSTPQQGEAGGVPSGNPKYYSFDYANIHLIGLDSMTSLRTTNSAMAQWLVNDLENNTQEWTIVYFHHPPYTKGSHNSDAETDLIEMRQNIIPILERYNVDLVMSGHSHCFERSYLIDGHYGLSTTLNENNKVDGGDGREDGTGAYKKNAEGRGVVYIVAGSSGQTSGGSLNHAAHFIGLNELGSVIIDVNSNRLDLSFLTSGTVSHDHFTLMKRGATPPVPLNVLAEFLATNEIRLRWVDVATNELGYIIERSLNGFSFVRIATNSANSVQFIDSGLLANTAYYYRVRSFNAEGDSIASNVAASSTAIPRPQLIATMHPVTLSRSLTLSGLSNSTYMIETTTNVGNPSSWQPWQSVTLSNTSQIIDVSAGGTNRIIFYRTRQ